MPDPAEVGIKGTEDAVSKLNYKTLAGNDAFALSALQNGLANGMNTMNQAMNAQVLQWANLTNTLAAATIAKSVELLLSVDPLEAMGAVAAGSVAGKAAVQASPFSPAAGAPSGTPPETEQ